ETPISHIQCDPFDSPWKPVTPPHRTSATASAPVHAHTTAPSQPAHAKPATTNFDGIDDLRAAVDDHERSIVEHALGKHRWNQRQTAKALSLSYDQLRHAIKKHGLMEQGE
ncbi:MAG: phage shock protein operon transcriptional activator, partial [Erythrobacter sp.]|nr:phage shock protein operon transcriptional activator [Erythrobacter sp.]